ncbi:MAG: hypothetical protein HZB66_00690 [Candidatus Aenigmarchaeota archaeon]|nr:hypothetical protein [Candidatus Aenigmarchaeota archaeon]
MKGDTDILVIVIEIVLIAIFTLVLVNLTRSLMKPDQQIVLANTELLRSAMNQACAGESEVKIDKLSFPQPKPAKLWGVTDILPRVFINSYADPDYLLYYEAFPPGEAVGWEVYNNELYYRVIAPVVLGSATSTQLPARAETISLINYKKETDAWKAAVADAFSKQFPGDKESKVKVFIPNIVLADELKVDPTEISVDETMESKLTPQSLGSWETDSYYAFTSYMTLSKEDRSLVKYRPCGENMLCLKTKDGIYTFPLEQCKGKIDFVQLVYDGRKLDVKDLIPGAAAGAGGTAAAIYIPHPVAKVAGAIAAGAGAVDFSWELVAWTARFKASNFYIASPCELQDITIKKYDDCSEYAGVLGYRGVYAPMYSYDQSSPDKSEIAFDGSGYFISTNNLEPGTTAGIHHTKSCLRVTITGKKTNYCWTPDASIRVTTSPFMAIGVNSLTAIASAIGGTPLRSATLMAVRGYDTIVLKPSDAAQKTLTTFQSWQKAWSWGWPGGGLT